ncbi:MAG: L-lactate dehydrogenase, partial [Opitutaceae bacterium]|nr:L-lactate dehydrogenase [Opitutaceae bacterium]
AYALIQRGTGGEIVMVDMDLKRAKAEAADLMHATPFANPMRVVAGKYDALADARVVILSAGVGRNADETRLQLLQRNAQVFKEVVPKVLKHAPNAILLIATNPVDIMTHLAARYAVKAGASARQVIGSGTTLDTARFRSILASRLGVDSRHLHGYVVGEHGDSEVLAWSRTTVGGIPLHEFCKLRHITLDDAARQAVDEEVRYAGRDIIAGKGSTFYGIGTALAAIVETIAHDQRSILTVCTPQAEVVGVKDVTVSLPQLVSGRGVLATFALSLDEKEQAKLVASATVVRKILDSLDAA